LIELPKLSPAPGLRAGAHVKILAGPFRGHIATLHADMNGADRVMVLLQILGSQQRVTLPRGDIVLAPKPGGP
jgi:transcription antitermination factor NusG